MARRGAKLAPGIREGSDYAIVLEGAERIEEMLDRDEWFGKPVKRALAKVGQRAKAAALAAAPRDTERLSKKITYRVNTRKTQPRWVAIATRAYRETGKRAPFPYPRVLEFSRKHGHRGWFLTAIRISLGRLSQYLGEAASEIEANWGAQRPSG